MFESSDIDCHFSHVLKVSLGFNANVSKKGGSAGGRCILPATNEGDRGKIEMKNSAGSAIIERLQLRNKIVRRSTKKELQ